jgi:hypothetical protein
MEDLETLVFQDIVDHQDMAVHKDLSWIIWYKIDEDAAATFRYMVDVYWTARLG